MLWIVSFAFLIAIAIFYGSIGKQMPGGETKLLGENEVALFETYQTAEQDMYYIELAAQLSAEKASEENFMRDFKNTFAEYLKGTQVTISDYTFDCSSASGMTTLIGKTDKELEYTENQYIYKVRPNFRVTLPEEIPECTEKIFV